MIKKHMQEQESLFLLSRQENHKNSNEISSLNRLLKELQDAKQVEQQKAEEIQQKSTDIDRSVQAALKRNQELLERCNELSKQCERERKQRYVT